MGGQMPQQQQQFHTELMLLQGDERIRNHREALKQRLAACGGLGLEELEYAVRVMLMSGRFAGTQVRPLPPRAARRPSGSASASRAAPLAPRSAPRSTPRSAPPVGSG